MRVAALRVMRARDHEDRSEKEGCRKLPQIYWSIARLRARQRCENPRRDKGERCGKKCWRRRFAACRERSALLLRAQLHAWLVAVCELNAARDERTF
jgi:hypothetical protein